MTILRVEKLSLFAGEASILRDVSISVERGEIVALTGESGSGKSMTAFSVMRLLPPAVRVTSGAISVDGENVLSLSEDQMCQIRGSKIGMVFQEPMSALNPVQTIGDQVSEAIRLQKKLPRREALTRARQLLDRVGLDEERFPLNRYPHELSGGQRQRVVIAIAIASKPTLLIADEPTTALDVTTQAQILTLLQGLVRELKIGMLIITHDLAVVAHLADRLAVMCKGEIVEEGKTADVLMRHTHAYTAALLEASQHKVSLPKFDEDTREAILCLNEVVCSYPGARTGLFNRETRVVAVDQASFELKHGERVGLVGESGCGKSTLARAILGLQEIDSGSILVTGRDIHSVRGKVQVVFQDPYGSFNPRHKVGRLIAEPFHLLDNQPTRQESLEKVARVLEAVGLRPDDANKYIHEFSGGQRQRIAIARALIIEPELIIFDEAVSALDVSVRARILDLLADLSRRYRLSYLFISHDLHVVETVTDRVLVMKSGQIVEAGETQSVFESPQHPYTRELLDATPKLSA